ncbi:MAG: hypothetical protein KAX44_04855 [Candidatus Brocadiae bacterium]|nr:hypothetical protein [Candidatus Brocadiia bacterium]
MGARWRVSAGLAVGGACAVSGQIILLRELLVAFHGNELSLGVILAGWLFWAAAGSWLIGARADRFRHPVSVLTLVLTLASLLLPATVLASVCLKKAIGASSVETLGFFEFVPAVLVLLAPLCLVLGSLFAIGARILDDLAPARNEVSRAYLLESAGAGAGGLVVSMVMLPLLEPLRLSFALGAVLLLVSFLLAGEVPARHLRAAARAFLVVLIVAFAVGAVSPRADALRRRIQWQGLDLLEAGNSLLGNLAAVDLHGEVSLYENGLLVATSGYRFHAEELVHLGMVQHPDPRSVLLIGGGLGGALHEILKYPVEHCDYVELDPQLIAMGRRHMPPQELAPLDDGRVAVHCVDGRYFVKNAPRKYDVVMLDLPGPRSAQLNRFYSLEFFEEVRRILRDDGVLVFEISSSEVYPAAEQRLLLASLRRTAGLAFPRVATLPGDMCYFVLSTGGASLTEAGAILERLSVAGIETQYVRETMLPFRLTPWRAAQLEQALQEKEQQARINRDFQPLGYLYDLAQWSAQFRGPLRRWVGKVIEARRWWAYVIPLVLFLVLAAVRYAGEGRAAGAGTRGIPSEGRRLAVGAAVGVTGISEIVFQVTVMVGFQVMYGHLFYRLGVMVAAFMAGLAVGSFWLWRRVEMSPARAWRGFLRVHVAILLYPLVLPLLFRCNLPSWLFMFLPAVSGILGGLEFPLAVRLWQRSGRGVGRAAGALYAIDSFGACVGAAIVGPFLIPLLGLVGICWWTALLNGCTLVLLLLPSRQPGRPARP